MRLTKDFIEGKIVDEEYFFTKKLAICVLTLQNGYQVTGEAGVVNPADFDEKIGKQIAKERAIDKVWMLEGYLLQEKMLNASHGG